MQHSSPPSSHSPIVPAYQDWLALRSWPVLRFVYAIGGLIPLLYLLGDWLIEPAAAEVLRLRLGYLLFWAVLSALSFKPGWRLPMALSYPLYTLVGVSFACLIDGQLLGRPEFILATSLLYLMGLLIAKSSLALVLVCGGLTVLATAVLLPALGLDATTVKRVVFFHLLWAGVCGVAAWVIQRLNRQLYRTESELHQLLAVNQHLLAETELLARTDALTALPNRRQFFRAAESALAESRASGRPLALLALDVDHFKRINDSGGHQLGDTVLREVALCCRASLRDSDLAARIGGEEFALLLPGTGLAQAEQLAERLRLAIAELQLPAAVTVSIGCAELAPGMDSADALLARADEALYAAKDGGRNRVSAGRRTTIAQ
ncbi:GGDEF domain-containing protein [Paucibacter sp. M5-1]|uniref:GGDEF domain-containing protein n=1 Tax=Paucibacter sp. M5-1 TaxID=3015998 RepID=UPI0010F83C05|nr:GGDEF domain-containing protein [Paucibacter sp. M5-1]MCZ7881411.1 GGDEF domain-containing protein [Paucibacter sp. M5-1]